MRIVKSLLFLLAISLFAAAVLPSAHADTWDKKTVVTFSQPVEIPGMVLPEGTYTFKLLDSPSDRHIVQIFNADGTRLITTVLAINDYRLQPTGDTVMKFSERPGDAPDALRAWFYPGDNFGQEFVYPKVRAAQLAQTGQVYVPAVAADTDNNTIRTAPIVAETPSQTEEDVNKDIETTPPSNTTAATAAPAPAPAETAAPVASTDAETMPKTASSTPLIALLGALSIGLALGLGLILKRAS